MEKKGADDVNPATLTLLHRDPFEVLRLVPAVYQPDEIKRQYRRLALILHPDKNRHPDSEAAFKKLTAAFEKLHDPLQQAASRAEAERQNGHNRRRGNSNSSNNRRTGGVHDGGGGGGGGGGGAGGWGGGACAREFPRWCREGEYVPEKEKEDEPTPYNSEQKDRPAQEFWDDVERLDKVLKEEAAEARELKALKRRVRNETRAAAEKELMDRLREDVLGDDEDTGAVEAKTASWHKFTSSTPRRKKTAGRGEHHETTTRDGAATSYNSARGGYGSRDGDDSITEAAAGTTRPDEGGAVAGRREGDAAPLSHSGAGADKDKGGEAFVCWVCRRGFKSAKGLAKHEAKSELHRINVELREFMSP